MAQVRKRVRLANPARRRRKMSPKQIRFFGTKRQKAALKAKRRGPARKRVTPKRRTTPRAAPCRRTAKATPRKTHRRRRVSNVGEIVTIGLNPAPRKRRKTTMAVRRKRRNPRKRVYRRRARSLRPRARTPIRRRRRSNPRRTTRRYSVRRKRRNPTRARAMLTGRVRDVVGVLGGAAATKLIVDRLPYNLNAGPIGYLSTGVVASILGFAVSTFGKQRALGQMMALGGFCYLTLRVLQDFVPGLAAISPIGLRGVMPSSFFSPQVQRSGSLTNFVTPAAVTQATAALQGVGMNRRFARVR